MFWQTRPHSYDKYNSEKRYQRCLPAVLNCFRSHSPLHPGAYQGPMMMCADPSDSSYHRMHLTPIHADAKGPTWQAASLGDPALLSVGMYGPVIYTVGEQTTLGSCGVYSVFGTSYSQSEPLFFETALKVEFLVAKFMNTQTRHTHN